MDLLGRGSPAAAAQILQRAAAAEPRSRSVREALARAQFDAGMYAAAADSFRVIVEASPADDYAHFGLGLALSRIGDPGGAAEYLALAVAMRPDAQHYTDALRQVRATLRARAEGQAATGTQEDKDAQAQDAQDAQAQDAQDAQAQDADAQAADAQKKDAQDTGTQGKDAE